MSFFVLALLGATLWRIAQSSRLVSISDSFEAGEVAYKLSRPQPYVDYITGCSTNSDCFFNPTRGCHCDGHNCLVEGTRHPDPFKSGVFDGANKFCKKNPSTFSTDWCICDQAAVIRADRNAEYRATLLEDQKEKQTPAQILIKEEANMQATYESKKQGQSGGKKPEVKSLSSEDPITAVYHVCTEMKDIPVVDASHCGVVFQTASDTYYAEYATGSLGSSKNGLPGSVVARRVGNGVALDNDKLAKLMWANGHAPMIKDMKAFKVFQRDDHLLGQSISPFEVAKWSIDYQLKYPYYSLTYRNCQHFSGSLFSKIRGVEFEVSRDLIDYYKLVGLSVGHNVVPGLSDILQGMGS